uniref:Uncharacterized protein n=1 Tax=Biomphalaria glabrata TaxID=6526 RepID=A0A2C9LXG3_BIOGL
MDFLIAYKEAKQFGFTKEEFFKMWDKQITLNMIIASKHLSKTRCGTETIVEATSHKAEKLLVELESEASQGHILNSDLEHLKSVSHKITDVIERSIRLNAESGSHKGQKIKRKCKQADLVNYELDNIHAKLNQEHVLMTDKVESHIAMMHQEVENLLQQTVSKDAPPILTEELPDLKKASSASMSTSNFDISKDALPIMIEELDGLKYITTNGQTVHSKSANLVHNISDEPNMTVSDTIPTNLLSDSEMLATNSFTKLTQAVHFVSSFAPKLLFGELGDKWSSVNSLTERDSTFSNGAYGSSVDADKMQSSVDANHLLGKQSGELDHHQLDFSATNLSSSFSMNGFVNFSTNNSNLSDISNTFQTNMYTKNLKDNNLLSTKKSSISMELPNSKNTPLNQEILQSEKIGIIRDQISLTDSVSSFSGVSDANPFNRIKKTSRSHEVDRSTCYSYELYTADPEIIKCFKTSAISIIQRPSYIPKYGDYFYMSSKHSLHKHSDLFYSSFYTIAKTELKVRLCHFFNENSELSVFAQFSGGALSQSNKRSVTLAGEGFISCGIVGGYRSVRIWKLEAFDCLKLSDSQELSVKANVGLVSNKPVTFKELVGKGYDLSGFFEFLWYVKVVKSK